MTIEVAQLTKRFGAVIAVDRVSLRVEEGSLTALLGPSGSGKTTILRSIAGLEIPDAGRISINGADVTNLPAQKRNIGFVFQHYALFKHMKVGDNIAFALRVRHWKRSAIRERVAELQTLLRIEGLEKRYPDEISGGQRQRVALARALASHPQVLLLDEPFSALDARVREELREWLRQLHDQLHVTSIFVTHDQTEAMELADRIVILRDGAVVQAGDPEDIVERPNSAFVVNFLGRANEIRGVAAHGVANLDGLKVAYPAANGTPRDVTAYFRPQQVQLGLQAGEGSFPSRVIRLVPTGGAIKVHLATANGSEFVAEVPTALRDELGLTPGLDLYAVPTGVQVFAREEEPAAP
jgi:sulfate transport system ATP-binding protein